MADIEERAEKAWREYIAGSDLITESARPPPDLNCQGQPLVVLFCG